MAPITLKVGLWQRVCSLLGHMLTARTLCTGCTCAAGDFVPAQLQSVLLAGVCGAGSVFAARKYTQPVKDDIGDKSVFE
jgi:uncharacterized integral membrane protein